MSGYGLRVRPLSGGRVLRGADVTPVVLAAVLSVVAMALVTKHAGGAAAEVAVLSMTVPVAFARRAVMVASGAVAAGTLVNYLVFGHLVRCGAGLPAAFYLAYSAGRAPIERRVRLLALAGALVSVAAQCMWDPNLGVSLIALIAPVTVAFFLAGCYVRSRGRLVAELGDRVHDVQARREATARLAVAADRELLSRGLDDALQVQLAALADAAVTARQPVGDRREALHRVESLARETLDTVRHMLGGLRDTSTAPRPGLDRLHELIAAPPWGSVSVSGAVRPLPGSVELAAYRVAEILCAPLLRAPGTPALIELIYTPTALAIQIRGVAADHADIPVAERIAQTRTALYGGTVEAHIAGDVLRWSTQFQLVSPRAS